MEAAEDDDLSLVRLSTSLLDDLSKSLPRLLYKRRHDARQVAHSSVRGKDLGYIIALIEPFQSDPQLLDTHLKTIVPQIADGLLQHLAFSKEKDGEHISLTKAASTLLYTLCKVRGRKVISGLLPNEPRYLELVVTTLERYASAQSNWQVHFTFLLWLSHLLLAPFDLATISASSDAVKLPQDLGVSSGLPTIVLRCLQVCLISLESSSVAQTTAATALARLAIRPDMQKYRLADDLITLLMPSLSSNEQDAIHKQLGTLRFLIALGKSADVAHLFQSMFSSCEALSSTTGSVTTNAMGRKLVLKAMSTLIMTSLRQSSYGTGARLLEESDALETTIEHHLQSLADPESLVRDAAAKALSNIILDLEASMGQDILEAVLQSIGEDMPVDGLHTADGFAWHGNTLTLAYALFKRSVPIAQLSAIISALLTALAFEQRTANGAVTGTSVRDAANFGLWSLARRFTTSELAAVQHQEQRTIFETLATHLLQSACLDPIGNVRRGSSAALQELVGRHPNHIPHGISLVQAVDFLAVGLRQRAMIEVAASAASLDHLYWTALVSGLTGWRGVASADAASREYAARSLIDLLQGASSDDQQHTMDTIVRLVRSCAEKDYECLHGLTLCLARWMEHTTTTVSSSVNVSIFWAALAAKHCFDNAFEIRALKSDLTLALVRFTTAYCRHVRQADAQLSSAPEALLSTFVQRLLDRYEPAVHKVIPDLVRAILATAAAIDPLDTNTLIQQVLKDCIKPTLHGSGRAFALAAKTSQDTGADPSILTALSQLCASTQVDWRIVGYQALQELDISHADVQQICTILCSGMRDYTIDQRGDVGSLVRVQAITCARLLLEHNANDAALQSIQGEILRLSLDRLNRVRLAAAQCRALFAMDMVQVVEVDSEHYFRLALSPIWDADTPSWARRALLEGVTSCAGSAAEHLIQNSRTVMCQALTTVPLDTLALIMQDFTDLLKASSTVSAMDLLSFLLQARTVQRLDDTGYKWRNLLAIVQRAHYKSTDVAKILTALSIYSCLAEIQSIRSEVIKKLFSMLKTNPYPKVRAAVADALYMITSAADMKTHDWSRPSAINKDAVAALERFV